MAWNGLNPSINQKVVISSITSFGGMSQVSIEAKYAIDESLSHQFVSDYGEMSGFTFTTNGSYCNKLRIYSGDYAERDPTELEIFGSNAFAKPGGNGGMGVHRKSSYSTIFCQKSSADTTHRCKHIIYSLQIKLYYIKWAGQIKIANS